MNAMFRLDDNTHMRLNPDEPGIVYVWRGGPSPFGAPEVLRLILTDPFTANRLANVVLEARERLITETIEHGDGPL